MTNRYSFTNRYAAHYANRVITIPDQVYENQRAFDGKTFPAIDTTGRKIRVRLDGEAYGLGTSGTGDPICRSRL